ncbi:MAG: hypothetical protein WBE82_10370 [Xanthobacteraceae bacterium]
MYDTPDAPARAPDPAAEQDLHGVLAQLASNLPEGAQKRQLTGPERAAILMLALGEQHGSGIWTLLDDDELRQISVVMSTIGTIEAGLVENLLLEFVSRMSPDNAATDAVIGDAVTGYIGARGSLAGPDPRRNAPQRQAASASAAGPSAPPPEPQTDLLAEFQAELQLEPQAEPQAEPRSSRPSGHDLLENEF